MSMEKFGVDDKTALQKQELDEVKGKLATLAASHEKTASDTQEVERLEKRAVELQIEIADQ